MTRFEYLKNNNLVFHLACLYGRYESVRIILKKYGSNQLDINKTDFKGRTCMDLAWNWLLNTKSSYQKSKNSVYQTDLKQVMFNGILYRCRRFKDERLSF